MSESNSGEQQIRKPEAQSATPEQDRRAHAAQRPEDPQSADDVMTKRQPGHEDADAAVLEASKKHTRRAFAVAAVSAAAGYGLWRYVEGPDPSDDMQPIPIRRVFETNASISQGVSREHALAPTYPLSKAENLRINGVAGLKQALVPESYRLQLVGARDAHPGHPRFSADVTKWKYRYMAEGTKEDQGHDTKIDPAKAKVPATGDQSQSKKPADSANTARKMAPAPVVDDAERKQNSDGEQEERGKEEAGLSDSTLKAGTHGLLLPLEDVTRLPRHELVTQFKCIEGWSQIVHWAGVRMADFLEAYPPELVGGREPRYVYMETPNGDYYVGYDMSICRHPQTLLVTEMMGQPLTQNHGLPLRIHMPTRYGYKQIKRIGLISYTDVKPDDYWTKLGYDWYAGL